MSSFEGWFEGGLIGLGLTDGLDELGLSWFRILEKFAI